jgi:hypothetical protein
MRLVAAEVPPASRGYQQSHDPQGNRTLPMSYLPRSGGCATHK